MSRFHDLWPFANRALTALMTLACASAAAGTDSKAMHLMLQVCLPDKKVHFDELNVDVSDIPPNISYKDFGQLLADAKAGGKDFKNPYKSTGETPQYDGMRVWRASAGDQLQPRINLRRTARGSDTGGNGALVDSTETDQPVFDDVVTIEQPADIIAISVRLPRPHDDQTEFVTYWFKPPKDISPRDYTPWLPAVSEEGPNNKSPGGSTWWLLMNGKSTLTYPVGDNAPRVRYKLTNSETQLAMETLRLRARRAAWLQQAINGLPMGGRAFHLVPPKGAPVPSC